MNASVRPAILRMTGLALLGLVLAGAFLAYLQPGFMLDLGTRILSCF